MENRLATRGMIAASIAVAAWTIPAACFAESMAGFQAGSMSGSLNDTQAGNQNTSQAGSTNSSQSQNEQNSQSMTRNNSSGASEVVGGPLTNSGPGFVNPGATNNTGDKVNAGNRAGMIGSPSMTLPAPPADMKKGGQGYNSPAARGITPQQAAPQTSNFVKSPMNNGDAGNNVGNVVNGAPSPKANVTNNPQPKSTASGAANNTNVQISSRPPEAQVKKSRPGAHMLTRTYRWFTKRR